MLLNILQNAIKFCPEGNIDIEVTLNEITGLLITTVADNGIGIKEDEISELFSPFKKLASGLPLNPNGTGLGLSICKEICL